MAENKTKPTDAGVEDYILSRASEQQRTDCHELMALLEKVTQHSPKMWGQASSAMARTACLYFKKLADLDPSVLEQLVAGSVAEVRRRYG